MDTGDSGGWWRRLRARPVVFGGLALGGIGGVVFVLVWFQPQTLLFDDVVDEEFPVTVPVEEPAEGDAPDDQAEDQSADTGDDDPVEGAAGADGRDAAEEPPAVTEPVELTTGSFSSRSRYRVEGRATTFTVADGSRLLRLEDFESTNGPDLFVYLTTADASASDDELGAEFVDLGTLTGNVGDQNYAIPDDVDLDRFDTVVIWCRRFTVGFGAADLVASS